MEDVGLRSTRLRTFDRTVFTVPNGQIPNVSLENFSLRDGFWFHHIVSLRYETTASQMRSVLQGIVSLLEKYPLANYFPTPVRFLRLGAYSLDVEIFAHLAARDWGHFLEPQGQLLLQIMEGLRPRERGWRSRRKPHSWPPLPAPTYPRSRRWIRQGSAAPRKTVTPRETDCCKCAIGSTWAILLDGEIFALVAALAQSNFLGCNPVPDITRFGTGARRNSRSLLVSPAGSRLLLYNLEIEASSRRTVLSTITALATSSVA